MLTNANVYDGTGNPEDHRKETPVQWGQRNDRPQQLPYGANHRRPDHRPAFRPQEHHAPYVPPQRPNHEFRRPRENKVILTLDSLVSTPQEILATEHQLHLPQPLPLVGVPSKENLNKYCDYHNEKSHSMNDCFHLKKQLEAALESGKLNHLVKDEPRNAIKGQVLADFINEVPVGSDAMVPRVTPYMIDHQRDCKEEWVLYTDGASNIKGSGAGLVLISLTKTDRNGCPGPTSGGLKEGKLCNCGSGLFHKVDRSKTASQNNQEGSEEVCVG
ncbi:hypothetical protein Tco_1181685 [Tanacetum coccineum]